MIVGQLAIYGNIYPGFNLKPTRQLSLLKGQR